MVITNPAQARVWLDHDPIVQKYWLSLAWDGWRTGGSLKDVIEETHTRSGARLGGRRALRPRAAPNDSVASADGSRPQTRP